MPAIAVAGAIYAGTTIATVGIAAMTAMQVVSAVGAIASGVGAVTGNKKLTMIGGLASLAGGIGSFAQGKGWMAGDVASDAADISNTSKMIAAPTPGIVDPSAAVVDPSAAVTADTGAALAGETAGDFARMDRVASTVAGDASGGAQLTSLSAPPEPAGLVNAGGVSGGLASAAAAGAPAASPVSSIFDAIGGVGKFMKDNKELTSLGMNFVGGMFDDKKTAETDLYNLRAAEMRQQTANASAVPDLTGLKVNPNAQVFNTPPSPIYQAPRVGLINATGR